MRLGPESTYFQYLAAGDWRVQQCDACQRFVFYPRVLCPHCGGDALSWVRPTGLGRIHSISVVHQPQAAGGNYNVSLIDLDEGVRLMSSIVGLDGRGAAIGERVRAKIIDAPPDGRKLVVFEAAEPGQ